MQRAEFDAHRRRLDRISAAIWAVILGSAAAVGLAVGYLWSFAPSIPLAVVLVLVAYEGWRRWGIRLVNNSWIKRSPELADRDLKWRRR